MLFKQASSSALSLFVASLTIIDGVTPQSHYPIIGVNSGVITSTGYRPPRRDILDLSNDLPQFSLYIQALNQMMATPETTLTSYFQIGGIHGRPFTAWDNVNPTSPTAGIPIGYCTHGNILFPTWHRPYLALLEQVMAGFAQTIAMTYKSSTYTKAADALRLPYWDWAAYPQQFPDVLTWPIVRINTPTGLKNVANPLYRYQFLTHPEPEAWFPTDEGPNDAYLAHQPCTLRTPNANNVSQDAYVQSVFAEEGQYLTPQVWSVFAKSTDFNTMSTTSNNGNAFEGPHGSVHAFIGGGGLTAGHMSPVSLSGFDPSFWLHHANVDRQIAMWQAIYPDAWMVNEASPGGTWTIYPNTIVSETTPLTPFTTGDKTTPWTSKSARYTKAFGYSYPDVQDWLMTPAQLSANVTARVNQLYNPDGTLSKRSKRSVRIGKRETVKEWTISVAVSNFAVGEAFAVDVSVGEVVVGKMVINSMPSKAELDAGGKRKTHAEFTLNKVLDAVPEDSVAAHLKENLKWSVIKSAGSIAVPNDQVDGLEVLVVDEDVTPPQDITEFPVYGKKTAHPEITA